MFEHANQESGFVTWYPINNTPGMPVSRHSSYEQTYNLSLTIYGKPSSLLKFMRCFAQVQAKLPHSHSVLQISYAPALREETARRNFFANALALTRATRGKGIIISSGARSAFELRGPYDVINMATLFGLSEQDAEVVIDDPPQPPRS